MKSMEHYLDRWFKTHKGITKENYLIMKEMHGMFSEPTIKTSDTKHIEIKEKYCSKCQTTKPLTGFHKNAASPYGVQTYCKACMNKTTGEIHRRKSKKKEKKLTDIATTGEIAKVKPNFESSYGVSIQSEEVDSIMIALNKVELNYKPTAEVICQTTGMKRYRVLGILKYLREHGVVKRKISEDGTLIYAPDNVSELNSPDLLISRNKKSKRL